MEAFESKGLNVHLGTFYIVSVEFHGYHMIVKKLR